MTATRAAAYIGGCSLLAAWLSSAASTSLREPQPRPDTERQAAGSATEVLAADVQAHAARLRQRLASPPAPQVPARNPFMFRPREMPPPRPAPPVRRLEAPPPAALPDEPPLVLIGVAEEHTPVGPVRTAMIAAEGNELFLVKAGDTVLGRYRVERVGADAVELKELTASTIRRLGLRY
jgi:hypothetical protein